MGAIVVFVAVFGGKVNRDAAIVADCEEVEQLFQVGAVTRWFLPD